MDEQIKDLEDTLRYAGAKSAKRAMVRFVKNVVVPEMRKLASENKKLAARLKSLEAAAKEAAKPAAEPAANN